MSQQLNGRRIACLIMAAGNASRYGSSKQMAELHGKPLIQHIIDAALPVFDCDLFCVLGANADQISRSINQQCTIIINNDWEEGLGTSIASGVREITQRNDYDGILIVLADQYLISSDDFSSMLSQFSETHIVATDYGNSAGVPALFPALFYAELSGLDGPSGAKKMLANHHDQVQRIQLANAYKDLDTPADMSRAQTKYHPVSADN